MECVRQSVSCPEDLIRNYLRKKGIESRPVAPDEESCHEEDKEIDGEIQLDLQTVTQEKHAEGNQKKFSGDKSFSSSPSPHHPVTDRSGQGKARDSRKAQQAGIE